MSQMLTADALLERSSVASEVIALLPAQGEWTEVDYLWLTNRSNHLVELSDGVIEVLPMPTEAHQRIALFLYRALYDYLSARTMGLVIVAPLRVRLSTGRFREPDLVLLLSAEDPRRHDDYWEGADLVIEVVSPDDPERDVVTKRFEYAESAIREYWIVEPEASTVTVLQLEQGRYVEHGVFVRGDTVTSPLLGGFAVGAAQVLDG